LGKLTLGKFCPRAYEWGGVKILCPEGKKRHSAKKFWLLFLVDDEMKLNFPRQKRRVKGEHSISFQMCINLKRYFLNRNHKHVLVKTVTKMCN
jgi:hypothetical protein